VERDPSMQMTPTCLFSATEAISTLARKPTILFLLERGGTDVFIDFVRGLSYKP